MAKMDYPILDSSALIIAESGGLKTSDLFLEVTKCASRTHGFGTDAAGTLGLVWVGNRAKREAWDKFGRLRHVGHLEFQIKFCWCLKTP